jgi:hypothetical protein
MRSLKGKACPSLFQECKGLQRKIKPSEKLLKFHFLFNQGSYIQNSTAKAGDMAASL